MGKVLKISTYKKKQETTKRKQNRQKKIKPEECTEAKCERIKTSITRINKLMSELRSMNKSKTDNNLRLVK